MSPSSSFQPSSSAAFVTGIITADDVPLSSSKQHQERYYHHLLQQQQQQQQKYNNKYTFCHPSAPSSSSLYHPRSIQPSPHSCRRPGDIKFLPKNDDARALKFSSFPLLGGLLSASSSVLAPSTFPPPSTTSVIAASEAASNAVAAVGEAATSVVAPASTGIGHFFQLLFVFVLGGIFFSTALSITTAFVAFGKTNISRGYDIFKNVILGRTWNIFVLGLRTTRDVLLVTTGEKKSWNWKAAWKELKKQLTITKQAAVESVQAVKLSASLYSAAIGKPGLIFLQYISENLTSKLYPTLAKQALLDALKEVKNPNVQRLILQEFDFGSKGPILMAARTYDLSKHRGGDEDEALAKVVGGGGDSSHHVIKDIDDGIAFDMDVKFDSDITAKIKVIPKSRTGITLGNLLSIPVKIKNFRFDGVVRVVLTPLTPDPPGFGAALISFPQAPKIGVDLSLGSVAEITKNPWIRTELMKEIQKAIADEVLWPRRIVVPSPASNKNPPSMLSRMLLEELTKSDPLLRAEKEINENEIIQKVKLQRIMPNEKELGLDVLVGDEESEKKEKEKAEEMLLKEENENGEETGNDEDKGEVQAPNDDDVVVVDDKTTKKNKKSNKWKNPFVRHRAG